MSKLRIEKLKQGSASNNDVLVFRNDLGTFQGQSNLSLTKITLGTNTVNSSVYTGSANYLNGQPASYYATSDGINTGYTNAVSFATTIAATAYANAISIAATDATNKAATAYSNSITYAATMAASAYSNAIYWANSYATTAYSNAVSIAATDATNKAATAYANAVLFANTISNTAFTNAVSVASTDATNKAGNAYSNAVTYADTRAATAYSNAIAYSGNAALAYANAIAYAASNTYVNSTFAPLASPTLTGTVTVTGNLVITGNTISINTTSINVTDSLLYLATNNEVSDILDIGFGAHYNAGSGANGHTGLVRSATTKKWYLFQNYQPELYANNTIDFANTGTGVQMADLVVGNLVANSTLIVTGSANVGSLNTTGTVTANVISVSNVEQTQTNLQVDPAGSAFLNAIIYG